MIQGYVIKVMQPHEIDEDRIRSLVLDAFGRGLSKDYFKTDDIFAVVVEENYRGVAILHMHQGWIYLDKFCVTKDLQGNGLGGIIFKEVVRLAAKGGLFWRTSASNPFVDWYLRRISTLGGRYRSAGKWIIFWIGDKCPEDVLRYAVAKPETLTGQRPSAYAASLKSALPVSSQSYSAECVAKTAP